MEIQEMGKRSTKEKLKYLFLFFIGILFSNCANQLPPGGGEIDYIPPEIVEVYPEDGTTNFDDEYIEFGFSEYVDKRTVKDAIFISPALEGQPELDWSGKYVRLYFPEELQENTTYVVNVGTDVVDYNNKNRMKESFILIFSTGNEIDKRVIKGKVYDEKPEGIMLFAYKNITDTLNPSEDKPDYISQTGKDGTYRLMGLAASEYRIFAIRDEFRDLLYQPEQDQYGCPYKEIILSEDDTLFSPLNFFITAEDTTPPRIVNAVVTDENHIVLKLNEKIDLSLISSNNFYLYDSTANEKVNVKYVYDNIKKPEEIVIVSERTFPADNSVYLFSDSLIDKSLNKYYDDFISLTLNEDPDTTFPGIIRTEPNEGSRDVDYQNPAFYFYFNDGFDTANAKKEITFADTSKNKVEYNIRFLDDASFVIKPIKDLKPEKEYFIKIDLNSIEDVAGNVIDSIYTYRFRTISGLDFTGVSGVVGNVEIEKNPVVILESIVQKAKYKKKLKNQNFNFDRVEPGKYLLWSFYDEDSTGEYSYGFPFPFETSERFTFYPDTLDLKPRWVQSDIRLDFR